MLWDWDNDLKARLKLASERSGEYVCELPLYEEYEEQIKSDYADVKLRRSSGRDDNRSPFPQKVHWRLSLGAFGHCRNGNVECTHRPQSQRRFGRGCAPADGYASQLVRPRPADFASAPRTLPRQSKPKADNPQRLSAFCVCAARMHLLVNQSSGCYQTIPAQAGMTYK